MDSVSLVLLRSIRKFTDRMKFVSSLTACQPLFVGKPEGSRPTAKIVSGTAQAVRSCINVQGTLSDCKPSSATSPRSHAILLQAWKACRPLFVGKPEGSRPSAKIVSGTAQAVRSCFNVQGTLSDCKPLSATSPRSHSVALQASKACRLCLSIVFALLMTSQYTHADEDAPKEKNPLRQSSETNSDTKDQANSSHKVRGTKIEAAPSSSSISFLIDGNEITAESSTASETPDEVTSTEQADAPKHKFTDIANTDSAKTDTATKTPIEIDPRDEYAMLHEGTSQATNATSTSDESTTEGSSEILFGEDTDNPEFTSDATNAIDPSADSTSPAPLDQVLDTDSVTELVENAVEFPDEDFPEEIKPEESMAEAESVKGESTDADATEIAKSDTPTSDSTNALSAGTSSRKRKFDPENNEDEDASTSKTDKPRITADLASKPILRRPKAISIEPIEDDPLVDPSEIKTSEQGAKVSIGQKNPATPKTVTKSSPTNDVKPLAIPIDPAVQKRATLATATLEYYLTHPERTSERSPWAVMHAILPFGPDAELVYRNQRVNAIAWMCANRLCKTQTIFTATSKSFRPNVGGGVQGHDGQFLAILAQSGVSSQYPLYVNQRQYTVADLVKFEMATCRPRSELTFKLIGLSYYLGTKQSWQSNDRQTWNVERLLSEEIKQPVNGAACGGTHRLMGIHFAVQQRKEDGQPINGQYAVAEKYIADYIDYAWSLQNPDGSFSTDWFERRAYDSDDERKVQTTGHILEWLIYASTSEELKNRKVGAAIDFLISRIYDRKQHKWPIGPRSHALRAIELYREKCLGLDPIVEAVKQVAAGNTKSIK
jgi:hypothetical protein